MRRSGSRGGHGRGGGARVLGLASLGLGVALGATAPARAAMGPAAGSHTAGEGAGGSGATGGFSASIALDLPAARGGTPLPLGVVYGGQRVGAAGLGWDVPLSYVVRNATLAHHRPKPDAFVTTGATVTPPVTYTLVLAGESVELVRNAANTAWVGRRGGMQLELRDAGAGAMVLYDGQGNTYSFSSQGNAAVPRLGGGDLFLLTDVVGLGSNAVHLDYDIGAPGLVAGDMAVNLVGVSYNKSPTTGGCYKHQVQLVYDAPVTGTPGPSGRPTPLGVAMVNGQTLTRLSTLSSVVVKAQSTCGSGFQTLKTYALSYQPDTDTRLPRLRAVTMTGQAGTPEGSVVMPVASFSPAVSLSAGVVVIIALIRRITLTL